MQHTIQAIGPSPRPNPKKSIHTLIINTKNINHMNIITHAHILLGILALACLTACDRKDSTDPEELATVRVSPDWQSQSPTAPSLQIRICDTQQATDGHPAANTDTTFALASTSEALLVLPEARYHLVAWHEAQGLSFDGTCFRLSTLSDGTLAEPAPLCASAITFSAVAGQETHPSLKMQPQTRPLKLTLQIGQGSPELLTDINATLTGCAATREISEEEADGGIRGTVDDWTRGTKSSETEEAGSIRLNFTRSGSTLSATHRLLGIVSSTPQQLTLTLHYAKGEPQTEVYDLTSFFSEFNNFNAENAEETFTLTGDLQLEQSLEETGISGTIVEWTQGTETDMEAGNH